MGASSRLAARRVILTFSRTNIRGTAIGSLRINENVLVSKGPETGVVVAPGVNECELAARVRGGYKRSGESPALVLVRIRDKPNEG